MVEKHPRKGTRQTMTEEQTGKCTCCGEDIDHVDQAVSALHDAICGFLQFGSPADLLEEVANHMRKHFESEDEDEIAADTNLTKN